MSETHSIVAHQAAGRVELCEARLIVEENSVPFAYDDATGKRVTCKPGGNLTIACGVNLEVGLDSEEIAWLTSHRLAKRDTALREFEWYCALDEPRGSVFLDVAFNTGVSGLLHFTTTIHYAALQEWPQCAAALLNSLAARKLPERYKKLAEILSPHGG
jgi:lysozyme